MKSFNSFKFRIKRLLYYWVTQLLFEICIWTYCPLFLLHLNRHLLFPYWLSEGRNYRHIVRARSWYDTELCFSYWVTVYSESVHCRTEKWAFTLIYTHYFFFFNRVTKIVTYHEILSLMLIKTGNIWTSLYECLSLYLFLIFLFDL